MPEFSDPGLDRLHGIVDDSERLEAQEVHLEHAYVFEAVHIVLRDVHRLGGVSVPAVLARLDADRHIVLERAGRDHDTRCVYRRVPGKTLECHGVVEELLVTTPLLVELLHLLELRDRLLDGEGLPRRVGDHLRDPVGLGRLYAEGSTHVTDHRAGLHGSERDDLADCALPVLLLHVLDDFAPPFIAEVDVDVGHRDPLRIQKTLEEEVEFERIEIGDPERISDDRARG